MAKIWQRYALTSEPVYTHGQTFDEEGSFLSRVMNGVLLKFFDAWCHFYWEVHGK